MKNKIVVTKDNYREIMTKRAIITCWILLAVCLVVKLLGGNYFAIICEEENFVKFCTFCDTSFIRYIIYFIYFMFDSCMLIKILQPEMKLRSKTFLAYFILCFMVWIFKVMCENETIIIDMASLSIICILLLYLLLTIFSRRFIASFLVVLYDAVLVSTSTFIKNLSFVTYLSELLLLSTIFYIDYYILLTITALYSYLKYLKKEKEKDNNGNWWMDGLAT